MGPVLRPRGGTTKTPNNTCIPNIRLRSAATSNPPDIKKRILKRSAKKPFTNFPTAYEKNRDPPIIPNSVSLK